jgi:hypothetical protein
VVFAQLPLPLTLSCVIWRHVLHKHGLQNSKKGTGPYHLAIISLHLSLLPAKISPPQPRQVKFVCDSLGMRFTEELNSHNCSFVICATPSGSDACAALQVTGDKMVQVCQRRVAARLATCNAQQATRRRIPCVRLQYLEACCVFGEQLSLDAFRSYPTAALAPILVVQ